MQNLTGPMLMIDAPAAGSSASGAVRISGWTSDANADPLPLAVLVDGEPATACLWRVGRPDVVAHYGLAGGIEYGFEGWVDLEGCTGTVTLGFTAPGHEEVAPVEFEIEGLVGSSAAVRIDGPSSGSMALDVVEVFGWAYGVDSEIESVVVEGPGASVDADYGIMRPEIVTEGVSAPAARCGWSATVDISMAGEGTVPFVVVVTDADGRTAVRWVSAKRAKPAIPAVDVERIEVAGGALRITGYTIWPDPLPEYVTATLSQGTETLAEGPADRARPDLLRQFPDRLSDPRCGFVLTAPLTAGGTTLTVRADDGRVARLDLPAVSSEGRAGSREASAAVLMEHAGEGDAVLDWGAGLPDSGWPVTVFRPPLDSDLLPHRDASVEVVVVPAGAGAARHEEAVRVASRTALAEVAGGGEYDVLWSHEAGGRWPSVSVLIPVHGQDQETDECLHALFGAVPNGIDLEVLVVDDASPSRSTFELLETWMARDSRVRAIRMEENVGYLRAVNAVASEAVNDVLVLLNNDTEPQPGWLEALLTTFERQPDAGVVGARLIYPDGTLQDAGGIIFSDGSAWNLGRELPPELPAFRFLRPVHYCTAAGFATPRALWEQVGGFDERFVPAYYEDVDYCFEVRKLGRAVLMQPASVIVHKEGRSHGTDVSSGVKAYQVANRAAFAGKWAAELESYGSRPEAPDLAGLRRIAMMGRT